jgi:iron complex transport system substrate-binding protein
MMEIAGCSYDMCHSGDRSAPIKDEDFIQMDPDYILIGPCGFSLKRAVEDTLKIYVTKPWWRTLRAVQNGNVFALAGNSYYARPGPRLVQGCGLIARCVHGEKVGKALGGDLAPSSGMQRITIDMYSG